MKASKTLERLIASSLGVLLFSCGATRYTGPTSTEDLTRLVLIIKELPDGQVTHAWHRAEEFDLSQYTYWSNANSAPGRIVPVSSRKRDCHAEHLECHRECKSSKPPPAYRHIPRGSARHDSFCWDKCKQPYLDCEKPQELQPREFTAMDGAIDWLKRNREAILVGSIVVIAGVVFVVVSAGGGLAILAPVMLMASSGSPSAPHITAVSP